LAPLLVIPGRATGSRERAPDDRLRANPESISPRRKWSNGFRACAFGASGNDEARRTQTNLEIPGSPLCGAPE